jgi:hypothetical protein
MTIPGRVLANWPAFFGIALVDYVTGMVMNSLPNMGGGMIGLVYNSAVNGASRVVDHVAWDTLKTGY